MSDAPYTLVIGDRTFSSWSLRGWLMLETFALPYRTRLVGLYAGTMAAELAEFAPARTVPVLRTPEGHVLTDSLAMAETLAERHPDAGLWPADPAARALARSIVAEMHAGFAALRTECPTMFAHSWSGFIPSDAVRADLARAESLWSLARDRHGDGGPWLFGAWSLADVFYAPLATRIATYALPVGAAARAYVDAHLAHRAFRRWRAMGLTVSYDPMPYRQPLAEAPWPGLAPLAAEVAQGPSINEACPYSGAPVTHFLASGGVTYGFCNAFCRDKTLHDPEAWPAFTALVAAHR